MKLYRNYGDMTLSSRCYSDTFSPHIKSKIVSAFKIHNAKEDDDYEISFSLRLFREIAWSRVVVNFDTRKICFLSESINSYHKHNKYFTRNINKYIYKYKSFKNIEFETMYRMRYTLIKSKKIIWKLGWVVNE